MISAAYFSNKKSPQHILKTIIQILTLDSCLKNVEITISWITLVRNHLLLFIWQKKYVAVAVSDKMVDIRR